MAEVLAHYEVSPQQVVAFGDGTADIPLLATAGLGIAVFPSNSKVRASANHVIEVEPIDKAIPFVANYSIAVTTQIKVYRTLTNFK
jgi:hydroxymethylpyrimidine pyrophosphatase-like HAD family hydrolase